MRVVLFCLFLFALLSSPAAAQRILPESALDSLTMRLAIDSATSKYDSLRKLSLLKLDSASNRVVTILHAPLKSIDSLKNKINGVSIKTPQIRYNLADSVNSRLRKNDLQDSLKTVYAGSIDKVEDKKQQIENQYAMLKDSLTLQQPVDKVNALVNENKAKIESLLDKPLKKTETQFSEFSKQAGGEGNLPTQLNTPGVAGNLNNAIPTPTLTNALPSLDYSKVQQATSGKAMEILPDGGVGGANVKSIDIQSLEIKAPLGNALATVEDRTDKLSNTTTDATDKITAYTEDVKKISEGNIEEAKALQHEALEATNIEEIEMLNKQTALAKKKEQEIRSFRNLEEFKKQTLAKAREVVAIQLATQTTQVSEVVTKISTHQKQGEGIYKSVKGLPARPLKSKKPPLIERFVPGLTWQVQKTNQWVIDINPALYFRARSIFSLGGGWNERVVIDKNGRIDEAHRIYGMRSFAELSVRKGLNIRLDVEKMNTAVTQINKPNDYTQREWVWSYMIGLKKDFKVVPGVKGNVQFMYNLYDPDNKSPYFNRLNVRFGLEFPYKKKRR